MRIPFLVKYRERIFLLVAIAATIALYAHNLELRSWTNDELGTILTSRMQSDSLLSLVRAIDLHPPTHYLMVHYWAKTFGDSLISMRLLDVIPIVLLVPLSYFYTKHLFSKQAAVFVVLLILVSPNLLYYSRMVRYYSWSVLFSSLSIASFLWFLDSKHRRSQVAFIAATAILGYLQYLTIAIVVICENLFFALSYKAKRLSQEHTYQWLRMQAAIVVLLLPMILVYTLPQVAHIFSARELNNSPHTSVNWLGMLTAMLYAFYAFSFSQNFFPWEFVYIIPGGVLFLLLLGIMYKFLKGNSYQLRFTFVFVLLPVVLVAFAMFVTGISTAISHAAAYSIFVLPLLLMVIAGSFSALHSKPLAYVLFFVLIIFNIFSVKNYLEYHTALCWDPNWKEVAEYVRTNSHPSDVIVANNPEHSIIRTSYVSHYLQRQTIDVLQNAPTPDSNREVSSGYREFENVVMNQHPERVWVIVRNRVPGEAILVENSLIRMGYEKVQAKGFWRNDGETRKFKNVLGSMSFLNFRAGDVGEYMISVNLFESRSGIRVSKGEQTQ
ncbi:MAG: glycosyltransferase family 39 protein [Bacteroidota bacterium]